MIQQMTFYDGIKDTVETYDYKLDDIAFLTIGFYGLEYMGDFEFNTNEIDDLVINLLKQIPFDDFEEFCCKFIIMLKNGNWLDLLSIDQYHEYPTICRPTGTKNIKQLIVNMLDEPEDLI